MFEKTRELKNIQKARKKASDTTTERKIENQLRVELRDKLEEYLDKGDSVVIEIPLDYLSIFLSLYHLEFESDYDCEPYGDSNNLFLFTAKEIQL